MSFNITNFDGKIIHQHTCIHDSNIGYFTDFSIDGNVDGWTYFDGIHTYGCWNNFLFGTLYGSYGVIGKPDVFRPIPAETFFTIKIVMKITIKERAEGQIIPTVGRVMWLTLSDPVWNTTKQLDFNISCDDKWHTYTLNMGEAQWWQGDINNLRIYPIFNNGRDGDEFLIKSIEILSTDTYLCNNVPCSYYPNYQHQCPGAGLRASCSSKLDELLVQGGVQFEFSQNKLYTIEEGLNDELLVNINNYGFEIVRLPVVSNVTGKRMATIMANEISKTAVGGYAEACVEFVDRNQFIIYSGTYTNDSSIEIGFNETAVYLGFFEADGVDVSTKSTGITPVNGFSPFSSFNVSTYQLNSLLESNGDTSIYFNPDYYSVEGGRSDWLTVGIGDPSKDVRGTDDLSHLINRSYRSLDNLGKTIIDFSHPFNSSGRITKVYVAVTLDGTESLSNYDRARGVDGVFGRDLYRQTLQLSGAKIMFFRPTRDGNFKVLPTELNIPNRDYAAGKLYSQCQEYVEIDCDLFVNKGDFIGVYNINVYVGKTLAGEETDALYYQIDGKASGTVSVAQPTGYGQAGLLFYARGLQRQNRLFFTLDLGKRTNIKNLNIFGDALTENLEYNIARCLDVDWEVDMFGGDFTTSHVVRYTPTRVDAFYNHPNVYYGKSCLNDGIKAVTDGVSGDGFSVEMGASYGSYSAANHKKDGGRTVIVNNPKYFQTNGDCEWLAVYYQIPQPSCPCEPKSMEDFSTDPIAFTIKFPYNKEKLVYKSKIFFKEVYNFRSFAMSLYRGDFYTLGNADDPRFELIPYRTDGTNTPWTEIILDGHSYKPENTESWELLNLYLANNPCVGGMIYKSSGIKEFSIGDREDFGNVIEYDPLGGMVYYETGSIANNEQYIQAVAIDWTNIVHKWEPVMAKGFRFYCDYHESTKICEFEVYCIVENYKPSIAGMVGVSYSSYGDLLWLGNVGENVDGDGVSAFIGDTPRYINVEITPITEIKLRSLNIDVSSEDVYTGEKGCDSLVLLESSKIDTINESDIISFKNVYGRPYDLYVDIDSGSDSNKGLIFYSKLNNADSITNPVVGSDAYYKKQDDYKLLNYQGNVAINCPVYALKNLADGAKTWYSYDDEQSWSYLGEISSSTSIDFSNASTTTITIIMLPTIVRSKWWKIGFYDKRISMTVREIKLYSDEQEITGATFYHHQGQSNINTSSTDVAVHLNNNNVFGSYYILNGSGGYIGIELPGTGVITKIVLYADNKYDYERSNNVAGIDECTGLYLYNEGTPYQTDVIQDLSYYGHEIQVTGSGIYCDVKNETIDISFPIYANLVAVTADAYQYFNGPYIITNAIDPDASTHWTTGYSTYPSDGYPHWYKIDFGAGNVKMVVKFYLWLRLNSECAPKSFTFNGSNDNSSWTNIYTGQTANTGNLQIFEFTNTNYYRYYLIYWTNSWYGTEMGIYTLRFVERKSVSQSSGSMFKSPIKFSGFSNEKILVKYANSTTCNSAEESFDFDIKRFTIDFFVKFNSLPSSGNYVVFAKSWAGNPMTVVTNQSSWALILYNNGGAYMLRFYINNDGTRVLACDVRLFLVTDVWYHISVCRGPESNISTDNDTFISTYYSYYLPCYISASIYIDGGFHYSYTRLSTVAGSTWGKHAFRSLQDVEIGENLNGCIENFRISSSHTPGGGRLPEPLVDNPKYPPTLKFEPYYRFSIYTSEDNFYYGNLIDSDVMFTYTDSYYNSESCWCRDYNSYFVIDLNQRHDLELIRSFPVDTAYQFTLSNYVKYSNRDTDLVEEAFELTDDQITKITNMSFSGEDRSTPDYWATSIGGNAESYIKENRYYQYADGINTTVATVTATSSFHIIDAFDIQIDFDLVEISNNNEWYTSFNVKDVNNSNNVLSVRRAFLSGTNQYAVYVQDNSGTETKTTYLYTNDTQGSFRITRDKRSFVVYIKTQDSPYFQVLYSYRFTGSLWSSSTIITLVTKSQASNYPPVKNYWDNFKINTYDYLRNYSTYNDARWVKISMANDGTTRTIKNIGIYPDVSNQKSVDLKYNTYWDYLGELVTNYTTDENIAFGATVSGSSEFGLMKLEHLTDGMAGSDINLCWGSDDSSTQWVIICLSEIQPIYRIKIYHGYDGLDTRYIANNYTVQVSTDGVAYTTIFTITNNTSFIRIHDLSVPVNAKFIKINISGYTASVKFLVWKNNNEGFQYWKGAVLREVEVYKYYGFSVLSSETTPIIAVDLRQNYFISGHSLLGIDTEDVWTDWDNSNSNFAYSNSNLSNPSKVSFGEWGMSPDYERWVVIKRNTATKYPSATEIHPIHDNDLEPAIPDYLKHIVISASSDELNTKPNPTEYPWMWRSSLSELNYDYDYIRFTTNRSLRIDYPSSSGVEHIYNIEGDHFGVDDLASWRDGCGFSIYIDDINNLDLTYGYFYLGGHDYTTAQNKITYRWNFTSISGSLQSGWNDLNLTFMYANSLDYTIPTDNKALDVRRLYTIKFSNIGIVFRGKGSQLRMNLDGFHIMRNHFEHSSAFDYGLYLHDHDLIKTDLSALDLHNCTIEFFIRPDWNWNGFDVFNDFKYRSLFHLANTANDVFGASMLQRGLEIYYGNLIDSFNIFVIPNVSNDTADKLFHMAFVFSNDGSGISNDRSTLHFYINNVLVAKSIETWTIKDAKHFYFIFGGQGLLIQKMGSGVTNTSAVDAVISNLKIYNYCKLNFEDFLTMMRI